MNKTSGARAPWGKEWKFLLMCCGFMLSTAAGAHGQSEFIRVGESGLLHNRLDSRGDRILDFSLAGFNNSNTALPDSLSVINNDPGRIVTVAPGAGDDRQRIQNAINQVSNLPLNGNGFRGVVQLTAGEFQVASALNIQSSGVILRGVGDGARDELSLTAGEA